jgi:hypothetical protein
MARAALFALAAAGCGQETGLLLEVGGPDGKSSVEAGGVALELVVAHPSWCERWVQDLSASRTRVDVSGRDLGQHPYRMLVRPVHLTDIDEPVRAMALLVDGAGRVIGQAQYGEMRWSAGEVLLHRARVELLARGAEPDGPVYATDDGCVCLPGQPWVGLGTGAGCDARIPTSFDRLVDTAGCELPPGRTTLPVPVCDGQLYPGEVADRQLPCFAAGAASACGVGVRGCRDQGGVAYETECVLQATDPALPSAALCDAYLGCERQACSDVIGCFRSALTPLELDCQLRVDRALGAAGVQPCPFDGAWRAVLDPQATGAGCVAAMLEGVAQPPFTVGLATAGVTSVEAVAASCPPTLGVEKIDVEQLELLPESFDVHFTVGDHLIHAKVHVAVGCSAAPSLVCQRA